jgi:hypothetical protein
MIGATAEAAEPEMVGADPANDAPIKVDIYQADAANDFRARAPAEYAEEEWRQRLKVVLGSRSDHFVDACLSRVIAVCKLPGQCCPTSTSVSAAIAVIDSLHPENEIQAALAVHVALLDATSGSMLARLTWGGTDCALRARQETIAARDWFDGAIV